MKVVLGIFSALLIFSSVPAATPANPYSAVAARNIFGLVPIPLPSADAASPAPPTKITPTGIMTIFGQKQALFKVAGTPKPGQPAKDESYVLGEGERQDDIEVTKIDSDAGVITFNNHGTIQELPLVAANGTGSAPSGSPMAAPMNNSGIPLPNMIRSPRFNPANRFGQARGVVQSGDVNNNNNSASAPGLPASGGEVVNGIYNPQSQTEGLSPEAQALLIEKNRLDTQDAVNKGLLPPLPPTAITPPDATAAEGSPLIAPPEPPMPGR